MREAFRRFLGVSSKVTITLCKDRGNTYNDFCNALKVVTAEETLLLLIDSEELIDAKQSCWDHLRTIDKWVCPPSATNEQVHFMATCVEAWLVADKDELEKFYGQSLNVHTTQNIEMVPKKDLQDRLETAIKATSKKKYSKSEHVPELLKTLDASVVRKRAPHCDRLFRELDRLGCRNI